MLRFIPYKRKQTGFTLLEMVVVIILISWLGIIVLGRVWKYRVYAEEAAVAATIGNIKSALGLEVAKLVVKGKAKDIALLDGSNPMLLMAQVPDTYLGEITNPQSITQKGTWYFDPKENTLNYIVSYPGNFHSGVEGIPRTRHRLTLVYTDVNHNRRFDRQVDEINGLDLVALEPYKWTVEK